MKIVGPVMVVCSIIVLVAPPHWGRWLLVDLLMVLCTIFWLFLTKEAYGPRNTR